jgi:type II secretory pathway pseudopilin PulG
MIQQRQPQLEKPSRKRASRDRAGGFTIIELLIVVAVIILLLSIVIVAMSAATRTSQKTRTAALMSSIKQALVRFKGDIGYYPPVLGVPTPGGPGGPVELRQLYANSVPHPAAANYSDHMQEYFSTCTLAEYLIGYGNHREDGYGIVNVDPPVGANFKWETENPPLGIRHPGPDGVWGATSHGAATGALADRMKYGTAYGSSGAPNALDQGKVWGPYLELKDEGLLAAVNYGAGGVETYFPGDTLPAGLNWDTMPKAIVDYWGMPIRYYRRPYPTGALGQSYRAVDRNGNGVMEPTEAVPTLSDVFVLRPWTIPPGAESNSAYPDAAGKTTSSRVLDAAEFALLSTGPDKRLNEDLSLDLPGAPGNSDNTDEANKDNIVEVGP